MKLVHLVGFITEKFVTMHGHMNVKFISRFTPAHHLSLPRARSIQPTPIPYL